MEDCVIILDDSDYEVEEITKPKKWVKGKL